MSADLLASKTTIIMNGTVEPPTRRPLPRSANSSASPDRLRTAKGQRPGSSDSDTSAGSNATSLSVAKRSPYNAQLPTFTNLERGNNSNTSLTNYTRPSAQYMPHGDSGSTARRSSPLAPAAEFQKHRPRQHSQGFFEPSLPSASLSDHSHMAGLTASQIAAQAAFQHQNAAHMRRRSQTVPDTQAEAGPVRRTSKGAISPLQTGQEDGSTGAPTEPQYRNGLVGNNASATAASSAFTRSMTHLTATSPVEGPEKESKKGLKGLRGLRPKHIGISRDKDKEARDKPLPSPNKLPGTSGLSHVMNASTTSLADTLSSNNSSMYNLNNGSTSTMVSVPGLDRGVSYEKEKTHKHHGLRQKLKMKDKDDHHNLPLSSANSNSRPLDANNPTSLYSFAPPSPGPTSGFAKSVSGLDLRHAGRALREKKKEERANASNLNLEPISSRGETEGDFAGLGLGTTLSNHSAAGSYMSTTPHANDPALREILSGFGLHNMTVDDAWDFLKAKILVIFEGEDVRIAVEDLNRLVIIHVQKCVHRHAPSIIIEDLNELFQTGFLSLNHTLRAVPDERLVPHLVNMWLFVFGKVLPYMQAVFLPLDHEFKGRGSVLTTPQAAAEFWGVLPNSDHGGALSSSPPTDGRDGITAAGDELEVRRTLLISFRDTVILPRYNVLKATFSRLSLESIDASLAALAASSNAASTGDRPGTAQSLDPNFASYSSQSSTLLGALSSAGRSRATSNVSNPAQEVAFESFSSPPAARPSDSSSAQVTETVGRMLQCVSVLASVQSGDEAQGKVEELAKELKLNWLGRGRTGRNRRGFVGTRVARPMTLRSVETVREREGSPTPTPTRAGTVNNKDREREEKRKSML
jgi:hypothetical protein